MNSRDHDYCKFVTKQNGFIQLDKIYNDYFSIVGLLYIVDSSDKERMKEAKAELNKILQNGTMRNVPLVVVANKQDLPST